MKVSATDVLSIQDGHFMDQYGRITLLRGVNLGGSSKLPFGYGHTEKQDTSDFFNGAASVSFIGRPFPLEEADEHFTRLQRWGLTFLRYVVTWEAIEHAGPGQLDYDYLKYIRAVMEKAGEYNMLIYVDPHQDVWSRWTGGDGAPMWTLECLGFEPRHFDATKAAVCLETCGVPASQYPKRIWRTNYGKLACATMFTLFWGGKKYAPTCHVDGVQIQEYLQSHYLGAMMALAEALQGLTNVVGFGIMNEPSCGYIGMNDLTQLVEVYQNGYAPTAFQGMVLGEGFAQDVGVWKSGLMTFIRRKPSRVEIVDPKGVRAWKQGFGCIWKEAGVWGLDDDGTPQLLQPHYFNGADFGNEFYMPFARRFTRQVHSLWPNALIFVELPPLASSAATFPTIRTDDIPHAVNAMHWYDAGTLRTSTWRSYFTLNTVTWMPVLGPTAERKAHQAQLAHIVKFGRTQMGNAPTLISETGIPYNMNNARAYISGDYSAQIDALDRTLSCLESQLVSYTLWNYTADNSHAFGDQWNLEDMSISSSDAEALAIRLAGGHTRRRDDAARGLKAFTRPHARKLTGVPLKSEFTLATAEYVVEYVSTSADSSAPTEIYVPYVHYPRGYRVTSSDGHCTIKKHASYDVIEYAHDPKAHKHRVIISPRTPLGGGPRREYAPLYLTVAVTIVAVTVLTLTKQR
ncbi:hypothetical protein PsorP6_014152 [Peronosclerospora sorghi]|uniref:Uncharacterized protein n=1 Tax=Peronosclerospora sorghi TaxID=230839 RepID=A0ACC0VH68_9STRA|nr:hypothetical protein PsorP6_014152 [Peronosclerospora sorghi]